MDDNLNVDNGVVKVKVFCLMTQLSDPTSFLSKIPDQCGYLVLQDGAILKSDGDLANAERLAGVVRKIEQISAGDSLVAGEKFDEIIVSYPTFYYKITSANQLIYVVKRRNSASSEGLSPKSTPHQHNSTRALNS
uniref:Late endosomal/lysosomal adaptor and MAPK and MTOR activator 4 n=1 Tax=Ditylenchus dipsaci TaxID=166011 RepID=A0A915CX59_9BILA